MAFFAFAFYAFFSVSKTSAQNVQQAYSGFSISGGPSVNEGNVFYNGAPICDDSWDNTDAGVFCRMMGYPDGTATSKSTYGRVASDFSMDNVQCNGNENSLLDCTHLTEDNCGSSEGAGVICSVPEQLSSLRARSTDTEITVTWTPADTTQNGVRGYIIGWGEGIPDEHTQVVGRNQTSFVIKDIVQGGEYVISAKAFNEAGNGRPIYETVRVDFYVPEDISSLRTQSSDTGITVSWSPADTDQNTVLGYIVGWNHHTQVVGSNQTSFVIKDIVPGGEYWISVKAFNDFGSSRPSSEFIRVKSDENNLKPYFDVDTGSKRVFARTGSTAKLTCTVRNLGDRKVSWIEEEQPFSPVHSCNIFETCYRVLSNDTAVVTTDDEVGVEHVAGTDDWTLTVSNVTRDTRFYQCWVNTDPKMVHRFYLNIY